jgi:hypothetical protein
MTAAPCAAGSNVQKENGSMPGGHIRVLVTACSALLLTATPFAGAAGQLARELGLVPADGPAVTAAAVLPTHANFALDQLRHERVREARLATRHNIKRLFHERGVSYPAAELFMRIFKQERTLELWVRPRDSQTFTLLKSYAICALAGDLGPKRRQGDNQTPEGFYAIGWFNPRSDFYLSLHLDYPNRRDRAAGLEGVSLGGDIYIHGGCLSEGCLAVTDDGIKELYWMAVEARSAGQHRIPVHIFPARLDDADYATLRRSFATQPELNRFWATLKPGYDFFEQHRRIPSIGMNAAGEYVLLGAAADQPLGDPLRDGAPRRIAPASPASRPPLGTPLGTPAGG